MRYTDEAHRILVTAEEGLRELMEQALAEHRYGDVAQIAPFADSVAALLRSEHTGASVDRPDRPAGRRKRVSRRRSNGKTPRRSSSRAAEHYPRFERDGDKLVKIGWSKKNEEVYEHRAPKGAITRFREHLAQSVQAGVIFTMDQVLPVLDGNGGEVPSYQAYLALAWLRENGAVRRKGRDGYAYSEREIDESKVEELWAALPDRR